jgi:hypothetical protein
MARTGGAVPWPDENRMRQAGKGFGQDEIKYWGNQGKKEGFGDQRSTLTPTGF